MGTKISALTEETAPNSTDMMVVVNGGVTQKVQIQNVVKAGTAIWARVYHNANQSITDATVTALAFNSERADTNTIHDTVTNNSRLTCQTAGVYSVVFSAAFAANATGYRYIGIRLDGGNILAYQSSLSLGAGQGNLMTVSTVFALAAAQYVEAIVYQNSGGALNVVSNVADSPEFMMIRMGA